MLKFLIFLLALAGFCLLSLAATPCDPPPIQGPAINSKSLEYINVLGGLKKKASADLLKIDQAFWPDMGVAMDPTAKALILSAKPLTRKRSSTNGDLVEIEIKGTISDKLLTFLNLWGTVVFSSTKFGSVQAYVPPERLATLVTFDGVKYIGTPGQAQINAADPTTSAHHTTSSAHHTTTTALPTTTTTTSVAYPEVISHRANYTQAEGYLGKKVKVGVLSDCVDLIGVAQSLGRLPNVTILPGAQGWGVSEGVAILEVIHQLAPDAELYFATAFGSDAAYAHNILDLAAAGCKVIVDNVFYFQEPVFEDGIIAQAVIEAVNTYGVIYLSAAGNQGNEFFHTSSTWEGNYNPTNWTTFTQSFSPFYEDVHLFTPTQAYNGITGAPTFITLHWSDPFFEAYADYDLFVFNSTGDLVSFSTNSALAFEIAQTYFLPSSNYSIVVARYFGPQRFLSLRAYSGVLQVTTNGFIFGHAATTEALAIGAIHEIAPDNYYHRKAVSGYITPEVFTADGPRKIYYQNGTYISGNLLASGGITRNKPDFIAADGLNTVTQGFQIYYGTSASAATAAGIAALAVSADPSITPQQFRAAAIATAVDALTPGYDITTGYGAFDAENLVNSLWKK